MGVAAATVDASGTATIVTSRASSGAVHDDDDDDAMLAERQEAWLAVHSSVRPLVPFKFGQTYVAYFALLALALFRSVRHLVIHHVLAINNHTCRYIGHNVGIHQTTISGMSNNFSRQFNLQEPCLLRPNNDVHIPQHMDVQAVLSEQSTLP